MGLDVAAADYINPGYEGQLPIIIKNQGNQKIKLFPGMRICQIVLHKVEPTPNRDYSQRKDVKYMGESNSLISKLHLDEELRACVAKVGGGNKGASASEMAEELSQYWKTLATQNFEEFSSKLDEETKRHLGLVI